MVVRGIPEDKIRPVVEGVAPKLDVFVNGSTDVNVARARQSASVARPADTALATPPKVRLMPREEVLDLRKDLPSEVDPPDVTFSVFVRLERGLDPDTRESAVERIESLTSRARWKLDAGSVEVPAANVDGLYKTPGVSYVEPGQTLRAPEPIVGDEVTPPDHDARQVSRRARQHRHGQAVLVGIIDVGGFDFAHEDFLEPGGRGTRWVAIWDQGGGPRPAPARWRPGPRFQGLSYGSEITKDHMDKAIVGAAARKMSATRLEPQSAMTAGSHGTHVASIAAGRRGVAGRAHLAGVLVALRPEDTAAQQSFYDSTRIADAVDYLLALAAELGTDHGPLPVSINISLGTNGHAHDTSSAMARWVDGVLTTPGRCVSVAAGNAGQVEPASPTDVGFFAGRIHAGGTFAATNLRHELGWVVAGGQIADVSENEMEIWYSAADRIDVEVRPPGGEWIGPIKPGCGARNVKLDNGTVLSVHSETYHPANGANRISILLSPFFGPSTDGVAAVGPIAAGEWRVRLTGTVVRDGRYDAWIERDDARPLAETTGTMWRYPSCFAPGSYTADRTINSLACAERPLSVANVDLAHNAPHVTSSRGPTRDGRFKPDIAADGTDIVAAGGFDRTRPWIAMTGTSMASPYVCGVAALMLGIAPHLTSAQILGIIRTTSMPLPGHDFSWRNDLGFGVIDAEACVEEAVVLARARERSQL